MNDLFKKWFVRGALIGFYGIRIIAVCVAIYGVYWVIRTLITIYF